MSDEIDRDELMSLMSDKLVLLRNNLKFKQSDLAKKIGISRQTLSEYESKKRAISWSVFLALLTLFREDESTNDLLLHFGIYSPKLSEYLVSPECKNNGANHND